MVILRIIYFVFYKCFTKTMATITWVILKHHKKADGTYNPKIRVSHKRTTAYMATSIFTPLVRFKRGSKNGTVTDGEIEDCLNGQVGELRKVLGLHPEVMESCQSAKEIIAFIERYLKRKNLEIDFIDFARKYIETLPTRGAREAKMPGINSLCFYLKETKGKEKLPINALTSRFLIGYEGWLRSRRTIMIKGFQRVREPLSDSGVNHYMVTIQTILNQAKRVYNDYEIGDIVIKIDPFKAYKIPNTVRPAKRAISKEEILRIYNYVPPRRGRTDELARDLFIMSLMLAGMNAVDLYNCKVISSGRIEYCRSKTCARKRNGNAFISIPIISEVAPLVIKYRADEGDRVFNFSQKYRRNLDLNVALHRGLGIIGQAVGIKNLQFYSARHSFATIARNDCDVSMDDIALCLTHSSGHDITDCYVKPDFSRVDRVIRKVVDFVFKDGPEGSTGNRPIMRVIGGKMVDKDEGVA